jgi:phosphoglycerol transferase MdoB-like AlkP superfamily enzyme
MLCLEKFMSKEMLIFYALFLLLNTFNTIIITHQRLNRYIAPFKHSFKGELNAFIGNMFSLNMIGFIVLLITQNGYYAMIILVVLTGIFNLLFFALNIFNLYYGTSFSREGLDIFKNPAEGISKGLSKEILNELFGYYRIILFIPFAILLFYLIHINQSILFDLNVMLSDLTILGTISLSVLMISITKYIYEKMYLQDFTIKAVKVTYGIQNFGIFPFYMASFLGYKLIPDSIYSRKKKNINELYQIYSSFDKNKSQYLNFFNKKLYSNQFSVNQLSKDITIDKSLVSKNSNLTGLLQGKNLVLVQMESMSRFLLDIPLLKSEFPFLKAILEESVDFTEFYSSVGIGVSSDAEVTTLTGLYPTGFSNLYWSDFDSETSQFKIKRELTTLPKYFNKQNYYTEAIHGDYKRFYNRENAYPTILDFKKLYGLEDFTDKTESGRQGIIKFFTYEYSKGQKHISPWISDYQLADTVQTKVKEHNSPSFYFPITMMPHTPFGFNPLQNKEYIEDCKLKDLTKKYLQFAEYYDNIIKRIFLNNLGENAIDPNTVYLFYGDHGCGLKNRDLSKLFAKDLSRLEERKILQQVVAFLYVPGEKLVDKNGYFLNEGLIKGKQGLVRGQMDIYRTIIELFGLKAENHAYFGTHLLSSEPSYVLDNKLQDVILDNFMFSMRNREKTFPKNKTVEHKLFENVKNFKLLNDILLEEKNIQTELNNLKKEKNNI